MIDPSKIADLVKKTLKGSGYKVKMYTETGDSTLDPRLARRFFTMPDKIMVTLEDNDNLLKFHKSSSVEIDDIRDLHKSIKNLASKYNMDFVMREFGKEIEPKNYVSDSIKVINDNDDNASEIKEALSKLAGTNLKSNQTLDNSTKIIIKHSKSIDEEVRGSRSRHIDTIYIENSQGERFRYPFKNMSGARAMARHIHEGGTPYDNVGKTIISVSEDNMKLAKFLRYSRNNGLNEANQDTIDAVSKKVESNKRFLHTLSNVNTYEATVDSIEDKIEEDKELDVANLKDAFTKRVFDENIEEVLPMVQKIIDEAGVAEAKKDPYAGMSMLDRAKKAELGPDISGEYSSKNIKKFADKKSEIVYKVTELNMRVMDDELNRVVTNAISKLEDGKNVSRDEVDIIKALIARGKELGAYQESVKADVVPEAEVAEWTEQVAGDKALFSEGDSVEDLKKQKAEAEDWFKKNPPPNPDSSGSQMDDAEYQQMVMHLDKIKDKLKKMGESIEEDRMGFSDLEKLGKEDASKVDMEARRRGSADMEPGDADKLRYEIAKEMGLVEDTVKEDDGFDIKSKLTPKQIKDAENDGLDLDDIDAQMYNNMQKDPMQIKKDIQDEIEEFLDHALGADKVPVDDVFYDFGDYRSEVILFADDATKKAYFGVRGIDDEDNVEEFIEACRQALADLGRVINNDELDDMQRQARKSFGLGEDIATIRSRAGLPEMEAVESTEEPVEEANDTEVKEDDEQTKTIKVNKEIQLAGDSIWDREGENPKSVMVDSVSIHDENDPDDVGEDMSYRMVNVQHNGPWTIYTDSGFEKAISDIVGFEVGFTEQGMQEDGMASMEGNIEESVDRDIELIKSRAGI